MVTLPEREEDAQGDAQSGGHHFFCVLILSVFARSLGFVPGESAWP
jgi:hypothetical protein